MLAGAGATLGLAVAALAADPCDPGKALSADAGRARVSIQDHLAFLEDGTRALTLEDVAGPRACASFTRPDAGSPLASRGGTRYWLRFRIDLGGQPARDWLLYLPNANFERACAHWPLAASGYSSDCVGPGRRSGAGSIRHNRLLFTLPDGLDGGRPFFFELESRAPQPVTGELVRAQLFFAEDQSRQFLGGVFNGLLFATVLYNAIFFVAARDRASLFFALHLLGLGLAMLGFEGRGREQLWPWLGPLGSSVPTLMLATAFLFGCLCGRDFLLTRQRAPRLDVLLRVAMIPALVAFPLSLASIDLAEQFAALAALSFVVSLVTAAAVLARRGFRPALYLLVGLSVFLAGLLGVSLRTLGISAIPGAWGVPLTRAGLVLASIAISAGLGRRVVELRRERDRAARDVVALEESLRRREQMAAMGSLVAGVAHEVRNPLFGISSTVDALEARLGAPAVAPHLETLRSQVGRLGKLMNDLLEYGRPPALERAPEQLAGVVEEASRACDHLARPAGLRIETRERVPLPLVFVDRKRMVQVFQNLLENALRHTPRGGSVEVELELDGAEGARLVRATVRDQGQGFTADDLPHVFEPFFTRRHGGTGLGLSIVRRIVEQHGGHVEAHNGGAGGAEVVVMLPIREGDVIAPVR
jgi:signal transduction histidine kinase